MLRQGHEGRTESHSSTNDESPIVRPRVATDDARIVQIYNLQEAGSAPLTIERYRAETAAQIAERRGEQWVAVEGGRVVGTAGFAVAWWTGSADVFAVDVRVDASHNRQGIGRKLYCLLETRLVTVGASRLLGWVRADREQSQQFAARHGFRDTGEVIEEYTLHVPQANTGAYEGLENRLRHEGVRLAPLAELEAKGESFLRALQALWPIQAICLPILSAFATRFHPGSERFCGRPACHPTHIG